MDIAIRVSACDQAMLLIYDHSYLREREFTVKHSTVIHSRFPLTLPQNTSAALFLGSVNDT
jgi:hypothetical protein